MNRFFPNYDTYKITSRFGMRTLKGVTRFHKGIDLVARTDAGKSATDSVTAHSSGTVTAVGYDASAGNYVKIETAPGVIMVYYHLKSTPFVKIRQNVTKGDKIGYMGATGNVTGAHLHFGIQVDGSWIDPEPWLDRDFQREGLPVLRRGDKCEAVRAMQALLNLRGCDCGKHGADASFGPETLAALAQFCGGAVCDDRVWRALIG